VSSTVLSGRGGAGTGVLASGADDLVVPSITLPEFVLGQARDLPALLTAVTQTPERVAVANDSAADSAACQRRKLAP
jgi:hypothetical protein